MKATRILLLAFFSLPTFAQSVHPSCTVYNQDWLVPVNDQDSTGHKPGGLHKDTGDIEGGCLYGGGQYATACSNNCFSSVPVRQGDTEDLTNPLLVHATSASPVVGSQSSGGPQTQCGAQYIFAVESCTVLGCGFAVNINGSINGVGGGVSYTSAPLWHGTLWQHSTICAAHVGPGCNPLGMPDYDAGPDGYWVWNGSPICAWVWKNLGSHTPIIIDTDGHGYDLTSAKGGVLFNFYGGASPKFHLGRTRAEYLNSSVIHR